MRRPRSQRTVVVDFGRGSIKMALAESAGEAVRFHGITRLSFHEGPEDTGGWGRRAQDLDSARVVECLRAEVERRGWRGMPAACLLSGSATSTQSFLFPPMPAEDLEQAIALKLRETLHFDLEDAYVDHIRLREQDSGDGSPALTLVAAARTDAVLHGVSALRQAGLRPVAVGAAAESLANLSQCTSLWNSEQASIHVDLGSNASILNLFEGNQLRFSREIDVGAEAFTRALMRPILTAAGPVQLSYEEAEELRAEHGYPLERDTGAYPHGIQPADVLPLIEPVAQRIAGEIRRSIDYLRGLLDRPAVDSVVLSGSGGTMRNLDRFLANQLDTPVSCGDPVARASFHWRLAVCGEQPPDLSDFAAILGYSLGNRRPINLLPREQRLELAVERFTRVRKAASVPVAALAFALLLAGVPIDHSFEDADRSVHLISERLQARLDEKQVRAAEREQLESELARLQSARGLVPSWVGVFKELSTILPAEAHVTSLQADCSSGAPELELAVRIDPGTLPFDAITTRISVALSSSPYFERVHVLEAELEEGADHGRYRATLRVVAGGAAIR